ncbi:DUF2585 family protein [Mangrovicella endophytica]|uniref:DUF2585 family protein n=1 Tax=Mangrovicella endophytica TaxID=2066697 RepID=UPI00130002EC|nr:DUF2585 family protein [Mangrovicella endophytica]
MSDILQPKPQDRSSPFPMNVRGRLWAGLGMIAVTLALLAAIGRPVTCPCGIVRLWQTGANPAENSQQFADWYSLLHIAFGIGLAAFVRWMRPAWSLGAMFLCVIFGHSIWEAMENTPAIVALFSSSPNAEHYAGDSLLNSLGDTLFALGGAATFPRLSRTGLIIILAAIETAVTLGVGDGFIVGTLRLLGVDI